MKMKDIIKEWLKESTGLPVEVATTRNPKLGDYTTNIAFSTGGDPRENARNILSNIKGKPDIVEKIETKNGFINIFLSKSALLGVIDTVRREGEFYGSCNKGDGRRILLEFVSANPTGPLEVPNGRAASIGDCLYRVLSFMGYSVDREYYVDNCGRQIKLLAESINARMSGEDVPEGRYRGDYINELSDEVRVLKPRDLEKFAVETILSQQRKTLTDFGVEFTNWVRESEIRKICPDIIGKLRKGGFIYEKDDAVWFTASSFGDEKDKVLIKSDGEFTYLTPDIAYHINKFERGYDTLIDILGPDHLGHILSLKGALEALGYPAGNLIVLISQWVTILEDGKKKRMSKREGRFVTLDEIISTIGKDVAKFIFLTRKRDSHLVFDMDVAKKESKENPVYYIQYAYARMSGIEGVARERGVGIDDSKTALLGNEEEMNILRKLIHFPEVLEEVERTFEPNHIPTYLTELASLFHTFYERHRVVSGDRDLSGARLALTAVIKQVLGNGLSLLGITAPERM
ncbi:arginine--tRNA ligase [candidate division WOR-3 bacterium JGI_Cruoil_03_44_89]|uniref:Arginine--tRNA ligase n=1 Tax=candidate division WOR-3 bacterium JGI_Cruoil_03_44_89 TaxID=1973748 RepID=A0A235BT60_UNCW3|nr:MAG: arginine--tRNA ligase [candidate division WOR-3 bacterium JGI_Cruoil_03_44_89]